MLYLCIYHSQIGSLSDRCDEILKKDLSLAGRVHDTRNRSLFRISVVHLQKFVLKMY